MSDKRTKGSRAARELVLTRWRKTSPRERSRMMARVVRARWRNKTDEEKRAEGLRLVEARRRKQAERAGLDPERQEPDQDRTDD